MASPSASPGSSKQRERKPTRLTTARTVILSKEIPIDVPIEKKVLYSPINFSHVPKEVNLPDYDWSKPPEVEKGGTEYNLPHLAKCVLCQTEEHHTWECRNFLKMYKKMARLNDLGLCINCLDPGHKSHKCKNTDIKCSKCGSHHYDFIFHQPDELFKSPAKRTFQTTLPLVAGQAQPQPEQKIPKEEIPINTGISEDEWKPFGPLIDFSEPEEKKSPDVLDFNAPEDTNPDNKPLIEYDEF